MQKKQINIRNANNFKILSKLQKKDKNALNTRVRDKIK